jgi:carboxylesterase type B
VAPSHFIPDAPSKLLRSGRFAKNIDIVNGWNENDGTIFAVIFGETNMTTDAEVISVVVYPLSSDTLDQNTTAELLSLYPLANYAPEQSGNQTATAQFFRAVQMFRDMQFLCPALLLEQTMANFSHPNKPTSYLFDLNTTIATPMFERENETYLDVAHGSDVPFVFGKVEILTTATTAQKQLSNAMPSSWSAFASSGNVSHGALTMPDWVEGYSGSGNIFNVKVLGGPGNGTSVISAHSTGALASEDLFKRCAFWTSQSDFDQLQE